MEGEGPEEGPLDEPGGVPVPVGDPWNPDAPTQNYNQERLTRNLRSGGRGCMVPWILAGAMTLVSVLALAGR